MIASGRPKRNSATHIHVSILPQIPLLSRLPHNSEQTSLCYKVGPCWLSILNTALCTCPSPSSPPKKSVTLSVVLLAAPWTVDCQALLSMGLPRSGLPFPSPEDLSDPGVELTSPALTGRFFTAEPPVLAFGLLLVLSILASTITTLPFLFSFEYARRIHNLGPLHWPFSLLEVSSFRYMNGFLSVKRLL